MYLNERQPYEKWSAGKNDNFTNALSNSDDIKILFLQKFLFLCQDIQDIWKNKDFKSMVTTNLPTV